MSTTDPIATLTRLLDEAERAGTTRDFWWRDDDAITPTPALDALFAQGAAASAPIALAVIPAGADDALLALCEAKGAAILQHGVSHDNHQGSGKSAELGDARPAGEVIAACVTARAKLVASPVFLPVMVPPWNRAAPVVIDGLAAAGYRGVSLFGAGPVGAPLIRVDTHIDPIAWRDGRDLQRAPILSAMITQAFAQSGPIGLLTHHFVHTPAVRDFVAAFAAAVSTHPAARWVHARDVFGAP